MFKNKKLLVIGLGILTLALVVGLNWEKVKAAQSYFSRHNTSSTFDLVSFMTPGTGTTTVSVAEGSVCSNYDVDGANLFIRAKASSTATVFQWSEQFSNDGTNWYELDKSGEYLTVGTGSLNTTEHASSTVMNRWNPGTTATSSKVVSLANVAANCRRVQFSIPIGGANGAVWAEITAKRQGAN